MTDTHEEKSLANPSLPSSARQSMELLNESIEDVATLPIIKSGVLHKKNKVPPASLKKFKHKDWKQHFAVLRGHLLICYKDESDVKSKKQPDHEDVLSLVGSYSDIAYTYTKRKHVFALKTYNGGEYRLQAVDDDDMKDWIAKIQQAKANEGAQLELDLIKRKAAEQGLNSPPSSRKTKGSSSPNATLTASTSSSSTSSTSSAASSSSQPTPPASAATSATPATSTPSSASPLVPTASVKKTDSKGASDAKKEEKKAEKEREKQEKEREKQEKEKEKLDKEQQKKEKERLEKQEKEERRLEKEREKEREKQEKQLEKEKKRSLEKSHKRGASVTSVSDADKSHALLGANGSSAAGGSGGASSATTSPTASATSTPAIAKKPGLRSKMGKMFKKDSSSQPDGSGSGDGRVDFQTFGVPLEDHLEFQDTLVPPIVEICINEVEKRGMDAVGIYRLSGNASMIQMLKEAFEKDPFAVNLSDERWEDIHGVSGVLKLYFRELPEALITHALYDKFIEASKILDYNERLYTVKDLVHELPATHYATLKLLMSHLRRVADLSEQNKMATNNLAIVFGPTIVRPAVENAMSMLNDMSYQCSLVETLISQSDWIFDDGKAEQQEYSEETNLQTSESAEYSEEYSQDAEAQGEDGGAEYPGGGDGEYATGQYDETTDASGDAGYDAEAGAAAADGSGGDVAYDAPSDASADAASAASD